MFIKDEMHLKDADLDKSYAIVLTACFKLK